MKALLKILYILLLLVIITLLAGIFLPKEAHVKTSVNIHAPENIVFDQLNDLKNWEGWSPWLGADTTMQISYGNRTVGEGGSYSWTSDHSGSGKLVITESVPVSGITVELDFGEYGKAKSYWTIEPDNGISNLTWTFENNDLSYFERYFMVLFKKNMINTFNQGLGKIKIIAEDLRLSRISEVKIVNLEKQPSMVIIDSCQIEEMDSLMATMYSRLSVYLERRKLTSTGPPFAIYYSWNPEGVSKFACGMPIEKRTWGWKDYTVIELPEGEAATVVHWGRYDSEKPYIAIDEFLKKKNMKAGEFIWEVYLNDPATQPDTSMWQKQIYYPIVESD